RAPSVCASSREAVNNWLLAACNCLIAQLPGRALTQPPPATYTGTRWRARPRCSPLRPAMDAPVLPGLLLPFPAGW
ncbi:MAG: hypothetical protein K6U89_11860, partial [Chloroflexi bacterium]|nr:hypothetical protein [Chloroflexota bacterium]